jgi:HEAT repeat protein/TolA-binding protein
MKTSKFVFILSIAAVMSIAVAQPAGTPPPQIPLYRAFDVTMSAKLAQIEAELQHVHLIPGRVPPTSPRFELDRAFDVASFGRLGQLEAELARAGAKLAAAQPMAEMEMRFLPTTPGVPFDPFDGFVWADGEAQTQQDAGYKTYKDGYGLILQEKWADARKKLEEVVSKYANSRYVDDAQYWIAYSWIQSNPKKAAKFYREFFKLYPSSNYFDDAVADLGRLEGKSAADSAIASRRQNQERSFRYQIPATTIAPAGVAPYVVAIPPVGSTTPSPSIYSPRASSRERNPELELKKNAIEALRRNPDERSLKMLQDIATDASQHRELRQSALYSLTGYESAKVLETYLTIAKNDPDIQIRQEALFNVGRVKDIGEEHSFEILKQFALDSSQPKELRETAMNSLRNKKGDVLGVYLQIARKDKETNIQQTALYYLGQLGKGSDEKVYQVLKEFAMDRTEERQVRESALHALREWKSSDVLNVYVDVAKNDPDKRMRQSALYYVGQLARSDGGKGYSVLKDFALDRQQDREVRQTAMNSLREWKSSDAINVYLDVAKDDPDKEMRQSALYYVGQLARSDDEKAYTVLKGYVLDRKQEFELRQTALNSLRELARSDVLRKKYGSEVGKLLKDLALDRTQPRELRKSAIYYIRDINEVDVYGLFVDLAMNDPDKEIQQTAVYYIAQNSKDKGKSVDLLIQLFDKLPTERTEALESCLYGVASVGDAKAVDFLIKVAKTHADYDLRQRAVYYLGNIGGDKARTALMDILKAK